MSVDRLAQALGQLGTVRAVAVAGSTATGMSDGRSDVDVYVYTDHEIPLDFRRSLLGPLSLGLELDNRTWETGDEFIDRDGRTKIDIMYRDPLWIETVLADLLEHNQASVGYSTCLLHNVSSSEILVDREGWFAALQVRAREPYPQELAAAIIAKNLPLLTERTSSFAWQMETASDRGDQVAVNHRIAAFLASYFDVLFAYNRALHPGEKQLQAHAARLSKLPANWERDVDRLLFHSVAGPSDDLRRAADTLADGLTDLIALDP